jgi:HAE1 family hydrophobic/amphiphilic exporter-1
LRIDIDFPRRTSLREIKATIEALETHLIKQRQTLEIEHIISTMHAHGSQRLYIYFLPVEQSRIPTLTLHQRLLKALPALPGVTYRLHGGRSIGSDSPGVMVHLQGPNSEVLANLAEVFKAQLRQMPGVYSVATDVDRGEEELHLSVDSERAQRRGVSPQGVAGTVAQAVSNRPTTTMTWHGREVDVLLRTGTDGELSAEQLQQITVAANGQSKPVRLGHLVDTHLQMTPASVRRENRLQTVDIEVRTQEGMSMGETARAMQQHLASLRLPDGYHWQLGESYQRFVESQQQSTFSITLAIVLVYLIMAALFESLVFPLTIMVTVPCALSGVVGMLMLTRTPLNQMADLGMLILCGLAVNSGIMLVEAANQWRAQGLDRTQALIRSGQQRLRPILMTVLTTLIGLLPMVLPLLLPSVFGEPYRHVHVYAPIALVVMGGLCSSTILTLLILPAVYTLFDDATLAWRQLRGLLVRAS